MEIVLPLVGAPDWMEGLVLSRHADGIHLQLRKTSGADYGHAVLTPAQLPTLFSLLGLELPK